jgi:hypothetical protein
MLDKEIRTLLRRDYLLKYYSDAESRVVEEMALSGHQVRIDIGVLNGKFIGYEIKSDHDTLRRLPNQLSIYTQVFDYLTIICGPTQLKKVKEITPEYCGLVVAEYVNGEPQLRTERKAQQSPNLDGFRLASLLWNEEARSFLSAHKIKGVSKLRRQDLWRKIGDHFDATYLSSQIREILKSRVNWRETEPQAQCGDSSL